MIKIFTLNLIVGIILLQPLICISQTFDKRVIFPKMPVKQTFTYKRDEPRYYIKNKKLDSAKLEVYLSEFPFLKTKETNYYLFYIKESISRQTDSLLLSFKNDTLFISASKVTRSTPSNRSKLTLKSVKTLPLLDMKNYKFIARNYDQTMNHWFDIFAAGVRFETYSVVVDKNETVFIASVEYNSFSERIHKLHFSTLRGIFKIDYY